MGRQRVSPRGEVTAVLAQVWECVDGVFAACHTVAGARARLVKDVLRADNLAAVTVEQFSPEAKP